MKKFLFGMLVAAALCVPASSNAQTTQVDLVGAGSLCGNVVITYWAVAGPGMCSKTESIPFTVAPGSGTFTVNLGNPANWVGGVLPPAGFIVEGCRVDFGCGMGGVPPTTSGCPLYDNMHLSDPANTCLNWWPNTDCMEDSGAACGTCGAGTTVNGSYTNIGGVVTITVW